MNIFFILGFVETISLPQSIFLANQWSNCAGTRGKGVPLPFLAGERHSPSLHDRCGWTHGNVAYPRVHSIIS